MDYRGNKGFTDSYSLLHGHHMDQGMMFGDLDKYAKEDFFNANTTGTLYTPETRYRLEIFAYMSVDAYDAVIYDPGNKDAAAQQALLDYIKEHTVNYHEIELTAEDRILAMSTCASAFTNGRSVVLARMTEIGRNEAGVVKDIQDK
jgi:sortase B